MALQAQQKEQKQQEAHGFRRERLSILVGAEGSVSDSEVVQGHTGPGFTFKSQVNRPGLSLFQASDLLPRDSSACSCHLFAHQIGRRIVADVGLDAQAMQRAAEEDPLAGGGRVFALPNQGSLLVDETQLFDVYRGLPTCNLVF